MIDYKTYLYLLFILFALAPFSLARLMSGKRSSVFGFVAALLIYTMFYSYINFFPASIPYTHNVFYFLQHNLATGLLLLGLALVWAFFEKCTFKIVFKIPFKGYSYTSRGRLAIIRIIFIAITEEVVYRGILFYSLAAVTNYMWLAIILSAICYGFNQWSFGIPNVITKTIFGILLGISLYLTSDIVVPILLHLFYNIYIFIYDRLFGIEIKSDVSVKKASI